ncbi:uncharacterized protein DDB_G0286379-like [Gordionus sp. m RMFG-2023]|uniref:uncharacterized protein DDB_G0286379-like n=1 Tax=Gordionus sp. m RMFG-2023 TaxID=3053472 RepID=UPI0031FDEDF2
MRLQVTSSITLHAAPVSNSIVSCSPFIFASIVALLTKDRRGVRGKIICIACVLPFAVWVSFSNEDSAIARRTVSSKIIELGADNTLSNEINVVISPQDLNQNDFEENYELGNMVHNNNTDKLLTIDDFATKDSHYRSGLGEKVLAALFINDAEHDKNTKYDNYEEGLPRRHSSESPFNDIDNDEINNNFVRKNRYSDSDNYNYLTNNLITDKVENDKESQDIKDNMHKRSNSDAGPGFIGSLDLNNPIPTSLLSKGGFFSRDSPIFQVLEKENEKQKQKDKENEIKKKTELLQPSESPPSSPPPSPPPPPPPPPPAPMNPINSPNHISNPTISRIYVKCNSKWFQSK